MSTSPAGREDAGVAIIGMAGRFPGARDIAEFWRNIQAGLESVTVHSEADLLASGVDPALIADPGYVRVSGFLPDIDLFDAAFFGYTPREAEMTDPQQRLFLECAWTALENAGQAPDRCSGAVGVFAGQSFPNYLVERIYPNRRLMAGAGGLQALIGNDKDYLPTRVSYKLNLKGPSIAVQSACSTSLVAVHLAAQSLLSGECDVALAGGVSLHRFGKQGYLYEEGGVLSPDGHCRAFDARAQGTALGDGVAVVVLKRLADAIEDRDTIHAVIKGSAVNNDGSGKIGFTAPSVDAQAAVIAEALAIAEIDPETVGLVEAHGTGTPLGDPIEVAALTRAFDGTDRRGYCALGSVKTNIGHLDAAAGVTGLIKITLALRDGVLPPSLHFESPNPNINFAASPFYVNTKLRVWGKGAWDKGAWDKGTTPRRAGISSFGIGGTNAHAVLEAAPPLPPSPSPSRKWQVVVLSAKTPEALDRATANLAVHFGQDDQPGFADTAYTLQVGRSAFSHRRAAVLGDAAEAAAVFGATGAERLLTGQAETPDRDVAFLFPGQGTQYVAMAAGLLESEPVFREAFDRCAELLRPGLETSLADLVYPATGSAEDNAHRLAMTAAAQPALFAVEYALAQLWSEWGIAPSVMIGHSLGEYVAACLAGVLSLEDALSLVAARGRLVQSLPPGVMLGVTLSESEVTPFLGPDVSLAAVNAPSACTLSGRAEAMGELERHLAAQGVEYRKLHTSHAFHSRMMEPILGEFAREVRKVHLEPPGIPYLSNVTGTWITPGEATDPDYWVRHLREPVRLSDGLARLLADPCPLLLEVGPGRTLGSLAARQNGGGAREPAVSSLRRPESREPDQAFTLGALARLWLGGAPVDWRRFRGGERRRRVPLPTYSFEPTRYWLGPPPGDGGAERPETITPPEQTVAAQPAGTLHGRPALPTTYVAPRTDLERTIAAIFVEVLGFEGLGVNDDLFDLGGNSLTATQVSTRLRQAFPVAVSLAAVFEGPTVARLSEVVEDLLIRKLEEQP